MRNHFQPGNALDFVALAGGVVSGKTVKKGGLIHVPSTTAAEGVAYSGDIQGVFIADAATSQAWTQGDTLYWDDAGKVWTKTATANSKGGMAAYDKLAAEALGKVLLVPTI